MKTPWVGPRSGIALLVLSAGTVAWAQASPTVLSPGGYGPVRIGMSVAQAQKSLGEKLVVDGDEKVNRECYHLRAQQGLTELAFMVQQGRIVRISIYQGPSTIATNKGIRLGDPIARVKAIYGPGLTDEDHEYLGPLGRYLTWWDAQAHRGVRYETDVEGRVVKIHAGDESIHLIEGCS